MGALILVLFFLSSSSLLLMTQASTSVPAFYVFGDSTVDVGNNKNIEDDIKANFYPYGVDYNNQSTVCITNGLTVVDFMGNYYFQVSLRFWGFEFCFCYEGCVLVF
ncbi:GDSL esterase/lipase [Camellia lanceoleosa]|uniref:GDSL esterase/lipase n=1 Tax=Camellia lanceoleosa TaxID=1840588 RepID=A0ACC0HAN5_9ERIC|nr:GDSL esterase/lipase [Camellia lanceoleosa]